MASEASKPEASQPGASRAGFVKLFSSPASILDSISPPGCKYTLNHNDRRWVSSFRKDIECDFWIDQYAARSFTRRFESRNWKTKLAEVHAHTWAKWDLNRVALPLGDAVEQVPGQVPEEALEALVEVVRNLPEPKVYH